MDGQLRGLSRSGGTGGNGEITSAGDIEVALEQVQNGGGGGMPAFSVTLSAKQISDVGAFVTVEVAAGE